MADMLRWTSGKAGFGLNDDGREDDETLEISLPPVLDSATGPRASANELVIPPASSDTTEGQIPVEREQV